MITVDEIRELADILITETREYVGKKIGALSSRLDDLEQRIKAIPVGPAGKDGQPGPVGPQGERGGYGEKGDPGKDGKDGRDGRDGIAKDGRDGEPGRDALQIEILPAVDESKSYSRGTYASHKGGLVRFDGREWICLVRGIDHETDELLDDSRTRVRKTFYTDGTVFERTSVSAVMLYREIFKDGTEYVRGDVVTWGNQTYHCQRTTKAKPGTNDDWKLMVRKGGDGKDGKDGQKGDPGPEGRPGRDLTQMAADGRKW